MLFLRLIICVFGIFLLLTHFLLQLHAVCIVPALVAAIFARACLLRLLGLVSRGRAASVLCLLSSLFFGLDQIGFVLLHSVLGILLFLRIREFFRGVFFRRASPFCAVSGEGA